MILKEVLNSVKDRISKDEKQRNEIGKIIRFKTKEMNKIKKNQQEAFLDKTFKRIKGEDENIISPTTKSSARAFKRK